MAQQVKSSHFQLGYTNTRPIDNKGIEDEVNRQKWNPQQHIAKNNFKQNNFSLGSTKNNTGVSQNANDYQNFSASFDPNAKAKRLELVNELRRSNLPSQNFDMPQSTA